MMYQMKGLGINFTNDHNRFLYWLLCKLSAPSKLALLPWLHNIFKRDKITKRAVKYTYAKTKLPLYCKSEVYHILACKNVFSCYTHYEVITLATPKYHSNGNLHNLCKLDR